MLKRPFYIATPRNIYGEHVRAAKYELRSTDEKGKNFEESFDLDFLKEEEKKRNDAHEAELQYMMYI